MTNSNCFQKSYCVIISNRTLETECVYNPKLRVFEQKQKITAINSIKLIFGCNTLMLHIYIF